MPDSKLWGIHAAATSNPGCSRPDSVHHQRTRSRAGAAAEKEGPPKQTLPASKHKQAKPKPEQAKLTPTPQVGQPQYDEKLFGSMRWRNVGHSAVAAFSQ